MKKESWASFRDFLSEKCKDKGIPLSATFELTARCNMQCRMCYVRDDSPQVLGLEKSADQWLELAKQAQELGVLYVLLTGGEVFLRPDFRRIYEGIYRLGIIPIIFSNGTLIGKEDVAWLKQMPPKHVGVTLYGGSPATYRSLCKYEDGFNKARQGIDNLLEAGITIELRTTVVQENVRDHQEILQFAKDRGQTLYFGSYIRPHRTEFLKENCTSRLTPKEVTQYHDTLYDLSPRKNCTDERQAGASPKIRKLSTMEHPFTCSVGSDSPWISWDGRMLPCGTFEEPATFPFLDGFEAAWSQLNTMVKLIPACEDCVGCDLQKYCYSCPARLKAETGSYTKKASYLCDLARETKSMLMNRK